jgi:hypothetical protein
MKTNIEQILAFKEGQPEPKDILVNGTPVKEGKKPGNILDAVSFSLAPRYSSEQLRKISRYSRRRSQGRNHFI